MSIDTASPTATAAAALAAASSSATPVTPAPTLPPSHNAQAYIDEIKREKAQNPLGPYPAVEYHNDRTDPARTKNAPVTDAQLDALAAALPSADASVAWQSSVFQAMHPTTGPAQPPAFSLLTDYTATLGYLAAAAKSHDQARIGLLGQTAARQAEDLGIPANSHDALARQALYGLAP